MRLILSKQDERKNMAVIYSIPNFNISEQVQDGLEEIHTYFKDKKAESGIIFYDFGAYSSALFEITSAWVPDLKERIILTLYFEEHENTSFFEHIMLDTIGLTFIISFLIYVPFIKQNFKLASRIEDSVYQNGLQSLGVMGCFYILITISMFLDRLFIIFLDTGGYGFFYFVGWLSALFAVLTAYFGFIKPSIENKKKNNKFEKTKNNKV